MSALSDPVPNAVAVTPSDTEQLPATRGLYVGVAGNIRVNMIGNGVQTLPIGEGWHPLRVDMVYETGTTADDILAGWG